MATVVNNLNGTLTITLSANEASVFAVVPLVQLEAYITLWMADKTKDEFHKRFWKLSSTDQALILNKYTSNEIVK